MTTGTPAPSALNFVNYGVYNDLIPAGGPKACPLYFDFAATPSVIFSLLIPIQNKTLDTPQACFIDNSQNNASLTLSISGTNQAITVPAGNQGIYPMLVNSNSSITVSSSGSGASSVTLINVPMTACQWGTSSGNFEFDGQGYLETHDMLLGPCVSGNLLYVNENVTGDVAKTYPKWIGSTRYSGIVTASGATNIITSASDTTWFIADLDIMLSGDASLASAGELIIELLDGGTVIFTKTIYLPAAAGTGALIQVFDKIGLNLNGKALNNTLSLNLSAALATGKLSYNIGGGTTTNAG